MRPSPSARQIRRKPQPLHLFARRASVRLLPTRSAYRPHHAAAPRHVDASGTTLATQRPKIRAGKGT
jgi:hypothetical protein